MRGSPGGCPGEDSWQQQYGPGHSLSPRQSPCHSPRSSITDENWLSPRPASGPSSRPTSPCGKRRHSSAELLGYSEKPINLQMFIGTADDRYLRPHAFYQVHRITGKTVATASILKLRNSDIELRKGETDIGRKNTRVRLVFRVHIPQPSGKVLSLQIASIPVECLCHSLCDPASFPPGGAAVSIKPEPEDQEPNFATIGLQDITLDDVNEIIGRDMSQISVSQGPEPMKHSQGSLQGGGDMPLRLKEPPISTRLISSVEQGTTST
ncbi:hypothetical protein U0070_006828 [Myodes glareolus]|uniref:RHD domain-containing protein n=1 Tax=Myodes glareolus TaxID=447135 RepID=A0AAW0HRS4_MYOGA